MYNKIIIKLIKIIIIKIIIIINETKY